MVTVEEINQAFSEKGVRIRLPLPSHFRVKHMDVLERKSLPKGVGVLLSLKYTDDEGREISELFYCEGEIEVRKEMPSQRLASLKEKMLAKRERMDFDSDEQAIAYLGEAIGHLLQEKGYTEIKGKEADLYYEKGGTGFFINLAPRCDEEGLRRAKGLVELRHKYGAGHDYGLVVPAFQEPLGLPLRLQEFWLSQNMEYLSAHRIGVYGVDNMDPNRIYPFTIYPKPRELLKYFFNTAQQWRLTRSRYSSVRSGGKLPADG